MRTVYIFLTIGIGKGCKLVFMKVTIPSMASIFGLALAVGSSVAVANEPKVAEPEPSKPDPPKITHENLYQMEELVKQGADPNAPYWLYPGLP